MFTNKTLKIISMLSVFILLTGCLRSFTGKDLPRRSYQEIITQASKPSIDYNASYNFTYYSPGDELHSKLRELYLREIEKVFSSTNYFHKFGTGPGLEKYHLSILLEVKGNEFTNLFSVLGFTLSICLIPYYQREDYTLTVAVERDNRVIKKYIYTDHINSYSQLFLGVILISSKYDPSQVRENIINNMLTNFLYDLSRDKIL